LQVFFFLRVWVSYSEGKCVRTQDLKTLPASQHHYIRSHYLECFSSSCFHLGPP